MQPTAETQARLEAAHEYLVSRGVTFAAGLTEGECRAAEERYGFVFPPDLRWFLTSWLPISRGFPNWRSLGPSVDEQVNWPLEGILFDVMNSQYWRTEWGSRPKSDEAAAAIATQHVRAAPKLIPVMNHVCLPSLPNSEGNPVFSVYQTDVIHGGASLADYLFRILPLDPFAERDPVTDPVYSPAYLIIPFWTQLAKENNG